MTAPASLPARRSARQTLAAVWLAFAVLLATVLLPATPAAAHDELIGSDPAAGSAVETLPAALTLTFSAEIAPDEGASEIQVTDAAGTTLNDGAPVVEGTTLTQALAGTASDEVTVLWKVVSSDGHPISGEFSFTVTAPPAPSPTESASPTPTTEPTPTAEPTVTPVESTTPEPVTTEPAASATPWIIGGVVVLLLVAAAVAYLIVSRARRTRPGARDGSDAAAGR
ncbi:copper resistance CopC family protein [Microbacterium sp. NPDC077184]|uniref:copper resistance CopC family protein n=1 Tax=Microbacterium sp. NPDC077184 TaxID=3154764 RepID=UPI00341281FA